MRVDRLRLLHDRDHLREGDADRHVRADRAASASRRPFASHGEVHVVSRVVGFKKIKFYTNENVGSGELDLPEQQMHTTSYWLTIPASVMARAAVRVRRSARRRRRAGVRAEAGGAAAADVRRPRHRHLDRQRGDRPRDRQRRARRRSSSTTTIRAASASARRCTRCTTSCSTGTRRLIAECQCESGCPGCVGPIGNTGSAREGRGAADPRSAAPGRRRAADALETAGGGRRGGHAVLSSLADRIRGIVAPGVRRVRPRCRPCTPGRRAGPRATRRRTHGRHRRRVLGGGVARRARFVVERRWEPVGAARRASGSARWRSGSSARRARRRCSPAAHRRGRRSCSSISRRPG